MVFLSERSPKTEWEKGFLAGLAVAVGECIEAGFHVSENDLFALDPDLEEEIAQNGTSRQRAYIEHRRKERALYG